MKKTLKTPKKTLETLETLAAHLRECAGVDAEYVDADYVYVHEGFREECIKINGVIVEGWNIPSADEESRWLVSLEELASELRQDAYVDAKFVGIHEGRSQGCIKINGVEFFWDRQGMYAGWEVTVTGWLRDMGRLQDGEPTSDEFKQFLRFNPHLKSSMMAVIKAEHVEYKKTPWGYTVMVASQSS